MRAGSAKFETQTRNGHLDALENRTIHPYSNFLLHDVGTRDGIAIVLVEHFGRERVEKRFREGCGTSNSHDASFGACRSHVGYGLDCHFRQHI